MTFTRQKQGFLNLEHTLDAGRAGEVRLPLQVDEAARRAKSKAKARAKAKRPKATAPRPATRPKKPVKRKKRSRPGMLR